MKNLFVYGTLQSDEVTKKLTGRAFKKSPAILSGYKVVCLKDKVYPGLIKESNSLAKGFVLHDVDYESFKIIRNWENPNYLLSTSEVNINDDNLKVYFFVWEATEIIDKEWDYENFKRYKLEAYLNNNIPPNS